LHDDRASACGAAPHSGAHPRAIGCGSRASGHVLGGARGTGAAGGYHRREWIVPGRRLDRYRAAGHDRRRGRKWPDCRRSGDGLRQAVIIPVMYSVVLHYGEIALKGRNRPWFLSALTRSVRRSLAGLNVVRVRSTIGRIVVTLEDESEWPAVRERLSCLPGIENFSLARHAPLDLDAITAAIVRHLPDRPVSSFRIRARRADKRFP